MSYHPNEMREIGKIMGKINLKEYDGQINQIETHLVKALSKPPRVGPRVDVLQHAFGYFSDFLNANEKAFFNQSIDSYRDGKIPYIAVMQLLKSWVIRFQTGYLAKQTLLNPYPSELFEIYKLP
jgi:uncharacterized protein YbgA (DUF1722 family)